MKMHKEFLVRFLQNLENELKLDIYPIKATINNKENFIVYEISNEEIVLSIDNKLLVKEIEISLIIYSKKYQKLRNIKEDFESLLFSIDKKPSDILIAGEDEEDGFYKSSIFLTFKI
ncbi:hypothetical protein [Campylobacter insulaenigrae]|uniref:Uncharacterized protein n=1 Tax=Campylobacter insulaenigrae NCTC 12927 TaxID=1031564 RepID=A0A0A8H186_9BACT|nr:hypothetical protein [Campylobacter insulaenigrae]AJC87806.1 hypothetical protein CINS_0842 [Campylobacter insulaenigrae NCTC 12927]MCR6572966.1 hypothetical protein [Campylobacter insulaenigrae]MCR6577432.1 hypothetical protein [Campylobacter insulaenigrae]MCR6581605.1 hypothetical protein [Campylobacter insulaenigrae]MCR6586869.1 hypothetical protein [Campylobacter insulaenigrae]